MDAVQRWLLVRTPATARRLRYVGTATAAFADAIRARNPAAQVATGDTDAAGPLDALVADDLAGLLAAAASGQLAAARVLTAAIPAGTRDPGALLSDLEAHGFTVMQLQPFMEPNAYFNDIAEDLVAPWRAGRLSAEPTPRALIVVAQRGEPRPRVLLSMISFAPTLMDIRTRLPAEAMRSDPALLVQHGKVGSQLGSAPVDQPKVLVLQRPAPPTDIGGWKAAMRTWSREGWVTVIEFDDHPELTARANSREMREADWIRFSCAHAVQTTTPLLRDLFRQHNPEVGLFPNAAFRLEPFPQALPKRVFYGAVSRGPYGVEVAASLGPTIAEFPGVEFVVVGDRAVFDALPTARKRYHDIVAYEAYLALMGACAVSLSPIQPDAIYAAKSDAKFVDAAARGVLTLASPTIYGDVIRHGENGLIAPTVADWAPMLAEALRDDEARQRMARNAWDDVRASRMFADQITARHDWYRDLWARREDLNVAMIARMGG